MQVRPYHSKLARIPWHSVNLIIYLNFAFRCAFFFMSFSRKTLVAPDESDGVGILSLIFSGMSVLFMGTMYILPHDGMRLLNQHSEFVTLIKGNRHLILGHAYKLAFKGYRFSQKIFVSSPTESDLKVRHWASYNYVILTLNYCFAACSGLPTMMTLRFFLKRREPQYLFYHLELLLPQLSNSNWLFPCCFLYEYMWFLWAGMIISTFYVYWCADIFTMNSVQRALW